jgi:hypothetical protein
MPTTVGLNKGTSDKNGGKGPATDYSMLLEMKRRSIIGIGVAVKAGLIGLERGRTTTVLSDRPMQRGFQEGPVTARLHLAGARKNFVKF